MVMFTIYESPPAAFVVQMVIACGDPACGGLPHPGPEQRARSLEEARALVPLGLVRMVRSPDDAPSVVETWL